MKQITVAIAGCGSRGGNTYASIQEKYPEEMKIVAIADPMEEKRERLRKKYDIPTDKCFTSAEEMLKEDKLADVMFICTYDQMHYGHVIPAMERGYDILLEKPISPKVEECLKVAETAERLGRKVMVCHVLRYTPFYQTIKKYLDEGSIGDIVAIQAAEQVGFWHQAHSFVRGNWRNSDETSPMLLQKSCHDMDILTWLSGGHCVSVSSVGGLREFKAEKAPEGATVRCIDCPYRWNGCQYSAVNFYLSKIRSGNVGWPVNVVLADATEETMTETLKTSPYGRCVYHCDNNVVDHQMVQLSMDNGVIINFVMSAFTVGGRDIRIMGTRGMLEGNMDKGMITVRQFRGDGKTDLIEIDVHKLTSDFSGHGGGDVRLVRDLFEIVSGDKSTSSALTSIDKSVESHVICMAAEESRLHGGELVRLDEYMRKYQ